MGIIIKGIVAIIWIGFVLYNWGHGLSVSPTSAFQEITQQLILIHGTIWFFGGLVVVHISDIGEKFTKKEP